MGIGGAYLCVYGMEGPGGYQFVGRTLQMWNRYRTVPAFDGQPWLLRFDQLRFYPVSADELARIRRDFPLGRFPCGSSRRNCTWPNTRTSCAARPRTSRPSNHTRPRLDAERQRWIDTGQAHFESDDTAAGAPRPKAPLPEGCHGVESDITGNLWQVRVQVGQQVQAGQELVVLESMKMEITVNAPQAGVVREVRAQPGASVRAGQCVVVIEANRGDSTR